MYEIRGLVDKDAKNIAFGVIAVGDVKGWVDDASMEFLELAPETAELKAARAEIEAQYRKIDAIYESGDFDRLAAVMSADAPKTSQGLRKASRATTVVDVNWTGDVAMVRSRVLWSNREDSTTDTWVRSGGGWRLRKSTTSTVRKVLPPTPADQTALLAAELRKSANVLEGVEAGAPFADLKAFGDAVGGARVVSLGEATHGSRDVFQMKHRLLEYLVREKGFTVFAIEANWPESEALDRYIKTGEGEPLAGLAAMYFWTWQTDEVLAMVEWMRAYNKAPGAHPVLSFTSFDMQHYEVARDRVLRYAKAFAGDNFEEIEKAYASLFVLNPRATTDPGFEAATVKAEEVFQLLEKKREKLTGASSAAEFRDVLQMARIVAQATRLRTTGAGVGYRDESMARNADWLLREAYPKEKMVIWAHNGHVSMEKFEQLLPMGSWLREMRGAELYTLGFAIHTGNVRAMTPGVGLAESPIPVAEAGSGTAVLSAAGVPRYFLDVRSQTGILRQWMAEPHLFRTCGAVWNRDQPESFMRQASLTKSFHGIVFLEKTEAAKGLNR